MPGLLEDPSQWRLRTSNGVPYKRVNTSGAFEGFEGESSAVETFLIPANQLIPFVASIFPPPVVVGSTSFQRTAPLQGLPFLFAKRVRYRAFKDGLPIDPFNTDPGAPAGTYGNTLTVDIEFLAKNDPEDSNDPETFLEITGDPSSEILHTASEAGGFVQDRSITTVSLVTKIKQPIIPVIMQVPQMEWSLRWPRINNAYFKNTLLPQIRKTLGKVNKSVFPLLFNAEIETLLFTGFRYREVYSITGENLNTITRAKFVTLDLKMTEKRFLDVGAGVSGNDVVRGHNDFWIPNIGWKRFVRTTSDFRLKTVYESIDFNDLLRPPAAPAPPAP